MTANPLVLMLRSLGGGPAGTGQHSNVSSYTVSSRLTRRSAILDSQPKGGGVRAHTLTHSHTVVKESGRNAGVSVDGAYPERRGGMDELTVSEEGRRLR